MVNDAPASSWMLNSAVYEYDEYTDQTPNPNCSVDYDGDGVCAGVDSDDNNSRVLVGPLIETIAQDSTALQLYLTGQRLSTLNYLRVVPQYVMDYIDYGWWPSYYVDYYSQLIYNYQCSYDDSNASCPFSSLSNGNGYYYVTVVDSNNVSSNSVLVYLSTATIDYAYQDSSGFFQVSGNRFNNPSHLRILPQWVQDNINWGVWPADAAYSWGYNTNISILQCSWDNNYVSCPLSAMDQLSSGAYSVAFVDSSGNASNSYSFTFTKPVIDYVTVSSSNSIDLTGSSMESFQFLNIIPQWVQDYINNGWYPQDAAYSWGYNTIIYSYQCSYGSNYISCPLSGIPLGADSYVVSVNGNSLTSNRVQFSLPSYIANAYQDSNYNLQLDGQRFSNSSSVIIGPDWVLDYIAWGWWPDYYASWYGGASLYSYQCSYNDTSINCPIPNNLSDGTHSVSVLNSSGIWSNRSSFYYVRPVPTFSNVTAYPKQGYIDFHGTNLARENYYIEIGSWYNYYYFYSSDCWSVSDTYLRCPYDSSRNTDNSTYGAFYSSIYSHSFNFNISGCTDPNAGNYAQGANVDDGSCDYTPVLGSHWKFDGDYNDYGTLGNHASYISSGVSLTSGGVAQFRASDNYGGSYIDLGWPTYSYNYWWGSYYAPTALTNAATTVSFWYKADTVANNPIFIDFKMGGGDTFITLSPGSSPGTHRVFWAPRGWGYTVGSQEYAVNGWTQVTIVYNGNGMWNWGGSEVSFYINGTLVSNTSWDCCNGGNIPYTNQLGRDSYTAQWGDNSRAYSGLLDDVRVYLGILIDSDILNLFNERVSLYFSGVLNGACYLNGTIVSYLTNGTGYCSGNEKYYMNDEQTTLDANGSGVHGGLRYVAGSLANGFVNGAGDDNNTVLLLHMDGNEGSNSFIDQSTIAHPVTPYGDAKISTANSKFGGSSLYLDGSGDYLSIPSNPALNLGTDDFTIEFWTYSMNQSVPYPNYLASEAGWYSGSFAIRFDAWGNGQSERYGLFWNPYGDPLLTSSSSYPENVWRHVAVVRHSGTLRYFVEGVEVASTSAGAGTAIDLSFGGYLRIGASGWDGSNGFVNDYIDEVRISNIARYTSNFNPPTIAFGAGGCFSNGVDTGTVINGTGTCEGVTYVKGSRRCFDMNGQDADEDGYCDFEDCDESSALVPAAREIPGDELDNNCNGEIDEVVWSWGHQGNQLGCSAQGASGTENFLGEAFGTSQHGGDCSAYCQNQFPGQVMCAQMYATWAYGGGHCACYSSSTTFSWPGWYDRDVWLLTITPP